MVRAGGCLGVLGFLPFSPGCPTCPFPPLLGVLRGHCGILPSDLRGHCGVSPPPAGHNDRDRQGHQECQGQRSEGLPLPLAVFLDLDINLLEAGKPGVVAGGLGAGQVPRRGGTAVHVGDRLMAAENLQPGEALVNDQTRLLDLLLLLLQKRYVLEHAFFNL